jgi:hypothetical protein
MLAIITDEFLLQFSAVVPLIFTLAFEAGARSADAQHTPIDLEQPKVGCVASLAIAWGKYQ